MQGGASLFVAFVHIHLFLEVYEWSDFIVLGCHMKHIELGVVDKQYIGADFLQVADEVNMAIEGRVEKRSEAFLVFFVDPYCYFLPGVLLVEVPSRQDLLFYKFAGVGDVELNELFLIVKTEMMQDVIFLLVLVDAGVQFGVFLQEILHF